MYVVRDTAITMWQLMSRNYTNLTCVQCTLRRLKSLLEDLIVIPRVASLLETIPMVLADLRRIADGFRVAPTGTPEQPLSPPPSGSGFVRFSFRFDSVFFLAFIPSGSGWPCKGDIAPFIRPCDLRIGSPTPHWRPCSFECRRECRCFLCHTSRDSILEPFSSSPCDPRESPSLCLYFTMKSMSPDARSASLAV